MRYRTLVAALLVPVIVLTGVAPARGLFDIGGAVQRAQMIVNQVTQIANQVRQMRTMTRQLTELEDQLDYMREMARGEVDALAEPFTELAAGPLGLVADGLDWGGEFSGAAGELVTAVRGMGTGTALTDHWRDVREEADLVSEADILALHGNQPPEASARAVGDYRRSREAADRQRVLDYAMMDAAAALTAAVAGAERSFGELAASGNLSNTALQQSGVAAALTQGRVDAAVGQVLAYQAVGEAHRAQEAERVRLEQLAAWRDARLRTNRTVGEMRTSALANRESLREGLLFRLPSFYTVPHS
ncbi:MAG: hypothetical protein OXT72_03320 [Gammaproteobacteria bacterium]|nr:hypothetical protein [Gammaproteobacteria bacterium]MDE0249289.1 hypothetical protein [Gammaproteobacteria bacterium]